MNYSIRIAGSTNRGSDDRAVAADSAKIDGRNQTRKGCGRADVRIGGTVEALALEEAVQSP